MSRPNDADVQEHTPGTRVCPQCAAVRKQEGRACGRCGASTLFAPRTLTINRLPLVVDG